MIKTLLKFFLVTAVLVAVAAAGFIATRQESPAIAVVHPARGPATQAVYATGTVEASVMLPIAPRQSARLVELLADEGQAVEKGQLLARLEDEDLRKTVEELQAKADLAQKDYGRKKILAGTRSISEEALENAEAVLDMAQAAAARAQVNLDYMKLTAPESGTIIRRDGEIGELIPAAQPVFWLAGGGGLRIDAEVDEEDIALVQAGQKAVISADAFPGKVFDGSVQSITPKGDAVARSYRVRIGLPADTKLMIGMTAEVNIIIRESSDALLVPASAIKDGSIGVMEEGKIALKPVETGARA
jgi:RND family efflux transporter MFP subunit